MNSTGMGICYIETYVCLNVSKCAHLTLCLKSTIKYGDSQLREMLCRGDQEYIDYAHNRY